MELEKALFFQVNNKDNPRIPIEDTNAKSDYVEEKNHASITETQEVMLSTELNSMTMTGKSGNSEIHNEEKLLAMWIQESQDSQEGCYNFSAKYFRYLTVQKLFVLYHGYQLTMLSLTSLIIDFCDISKSVFVFEETDESSIFY
ncbi:hypothetical protein L1987_86909 [Smallanthus sonchifolius]|uniref:Uncharacterized protein n=1 Tax=Smallanthus sonchifolius TaxID=185202 RepID=A0ACB8Y4W1_9ASTR|nr:hypothetical protein L1987_86909 [Smallanthus sonchifolius]